MRASAASRSGSFTTPFSGAPTPDGTAAAVSAGVDEQVVPNATDGSRAHEQASEQALSGDEPQRL